MIRPSGLPELCRLHATSSKSVHGPTPKFGARVKLSNVFTFAYITQSNITSILLDSREDGDATLRGDQSVYLPRFVERGV